MLFYALLFTFRVHRKQLYFHALNCPRRQNDSTSSKINGKHNVISEHDYSIKREEADFSDEFDDEESQLIPNYPIATTSSNLKANSTKNTTSFM